MALVTAISPKAKSRRKTILVVLGLALAGCSGSAFRTNRQKFEGDSELAMVSGSTNRVLTSFQMLQALPKANVVVNDPVYGKPKRYEGFWLGEVLQLGGIGFTDGNVLVISALDGYQARLSHLPGPQAKPLLAIRDLEQPTGWEVLTNGKEQFTPGPFYLVWQTAPGTNAVDPGLPWPYQINRLEVRSAAESQRQLTPPGADTRPDVMRGFNLFTKSCIPCHSVNLEGGVLGPELNVPRNITEYRERPYLIEFVRDPSSFRARSKMPAFQDSFSREDIEDILNYLRWMRDHKR